MIRTIEINKIKGIDNYKLEVDLIPNIPTIIVAPNGFGKSSIACAFDSLRTKDLKLEDRDQNENSDSTDYYLKIETCKNNINKNYTSDINRNDLYKDFDVNVIKNGLTTKNRKTFMNGSQNVTSSISLKKVVLKNKILKKVNIKFQKGNLKKSGNFFFKFNYDLSDFLKNKENVIKLNRDLRSITLLTDLKGFEQIISEINELCEANPKGPSLVEINQHYLDLLLKIERFKSVYEKYNYHEKNSDSKFIFILMLIFFAKEESESIKSAAEYFKYEKQVEQLKSTFEAISKRGSLIKVIQDNKKGLYIDFPDVDKISNGERDLFTFIANLEKIKFKLKNSTNKDIILIIDDVFDYFDDFNLVIVQNILLEFIAECSKLGIDIYPLIMTHLDPAYFYNFVFNNMKICYLYNKCDSSTSKLKKVILNRVRYDSEYNTLNGFDGVSCSYLHYSIKYVDMSQIFSDQISSKILNSIDFEKYLFAEINKYIKNISADNLAVACAIRFFTEKYLYFQLNNNDRKEFLATHKTKAKIDFAKSKGVEILQIFEFMGSIYNELMHLEENCSKGLLEHLDLKFTNLFMRNIIVQFCETIDINSLIDAK